MITFNHFEEAIKIIQEFSQEIDKFEKMGYYIAEMPIVDMTSRLLDLFIKSHFTEKGTDLIYWWLYENVEKVITLENNEKVYIETLEDLWDFMISDKDTYFNN